MAKVKAQAKKFYPTFLALQRKNFLKLRDSYDATINSDGWLILTIREYADLLLLLDYLEGINEPHFIVTYESEGLRGVAIVFLPRLKTKLYYDWELSRDKEKIEKEG